MAAKTTGRAANRRSRAAVALLLGGGAWVLAAPAAAQEIGLDIAVGRTDLPQLEVPIGLGLRVVARPAPFFGLEVGYTHVRSSSSFDGATCGGWFIPNCTRQRVESSTAVGTISAMVRPWGARGV